MNLKEIQLRLGNIKATKIDHLESWQLKLDNGSVLTAQYKNGKFIKFIIDGKSKEETLKTLGV